MASSSSSSGPIIIDPEEKFAIGNLGHKLIMTSVMLEYKDEHWSGTIVAQKDGKTLVLTVAKVLERVPWELVEKNVTARFYEDQDKKYPCKLVLFEPDSNVALFVVDKHTNHKLSFAPENEWDLKDFQILGCRGHGWRIATGEVCYPEILPKLEPKIIPGRRRKEELDEDSPKIPYFGHKLDLGIGYLGAALVNEKGNIVGLQALEPVNSYNVLSAKGDSIWIHVPKSRAKLAIHVKYMHGIHGQYLKGAGLEKALENRI